MIKKVMLICLSVIFFMACKNDKKENAETALDTGRQFIRASLNGDFVSAEKLLLKDTQNLQLFDSYKAYYERLPKERKKHYKDASYEINKYEDANDSTTLINYSNDYMNKPMDIKVVRVNNEWRIDFKYTYAGNSSFN